MPRKDGGFVMKVNGSRSRVLVLIRLPIALTCALMLVPGNATLVARQAQPTTVQDAVKIPADQLDSLVAPIALYPDNLLSQTLVASTYPLEIIKLRRWLKKNASTEKNKKKWTGAIKKHPGDPSIKA